MYCKTGGIRPIQWLCGKLTNHKHNKLIGWTEHTKHCPPNCKTEYYYRCKICKFMFWNYEPPAEQKELSEQYQKGCDKIDL